MFFFWGPSRDRNRLERVTQSFNLCFFWVHFWQQPELLGSCSSSSSSSSSSKAVQRDLPKSSTLHFWKTESFCVVVVVVVVIGCFLFVVVGGGGGGGSGDGWCCCCCGIPSLQCFLNSFE